MKENNDKKGVSALKEITSAFLKNTENGFLGAKVDLNLWKARAIETISGAIEPLESSGHSFSNKDIATCLLQAAQMGLIFGTDCYVLPFKIFSPDRDASKKAELAFSLGYKGVLKILKRNGVRLIAHNVVYESDDFTPPTYKIDKDGFSASFSHTPSSKEGVDPTHLYFVFDDNGITKVFVFNWSEIKRAEREYGNAFKNSQAKEWASKTGKSPYIKKDNMWDKDLISMAVKHFLKRLSRYFVVDDLSATVLQNMGKNIEEEKEKNTIERDSLAVDPTPIANGLTEIKETKDAKEDQKETKPGDNNTEEKKKQSGASDIDNF